MATWPQPNPAAPPGPRLDPRLQVEVVAQNNGWAQIRCENGWSAWVDGRLLRDMRGAPALTPAPPQAPPRPATPVVPAAAVAPASTATPVAPVAPASTASPGVPPAVPALVAAAVIGVSTLLPWLKFGGNSVNAFRVPVRLLYDYKAMTAGGLNVGILLLVACGVGVAATLRPGLASVARVAGGAAALMATMYAAQIQRALSQSSGAPGLFSVLGVGTFIALVAGVALAALTKRSTRAAAAGQP